MECFLRNYVMRLSILETTLWCWSNVDMVVHWVCWLDLKKHKSCTIIYKCWISLNCTDAESKNGSTVQPNHGTVSFLAMVIQGSRGKCFKHILGITKKPKTLQYHSKNNIWNKALRRQQKNCKTEFVFKLCLKIYVNKKLDNEKKV